MLRGIHLKQAFARGENISALLRAENEGRTNSEAIIEAAYDLQAGTYVARQGPEASRIYKRGYAAEIVRVIQRFCQPASILEAGVGEATTLSYVLQALGTPSIPAAGVDLCWSRLRWARQWLRDQSLPDVKLAAGTLARMPFADNAFDVVYTSHSIEPNGGREAEILAELHRITGRYLVLLEPGYELGDDAARARMEEHGYCRDLPGHATRLGMKVITHELFPIIARKENPTALTVIEKSTSQVAGDVRWACPECHDPLILTSGFHYCPTCFFAFPILVGLPCLRSDKAVIASQLLDFPES